MTTKTPEPLPPETRTVGQLVAESIRLYGRRFWPSLALGLAPAGVAQIVVGSSRVVWAIVFATLGSSLFTAAFIAASTLVSGTRLTPRSAATAFAAGVLVFLPATLLVEIYVLPALAWLAFAGLAVPAAVIERRGLRASLKRGIELARADYVHALGGLCTLAITVFLTHTVLFFLLRGNGGATGRAAEFLADLVLSPLLFLGSALLYFDQAARVKLRGDANLHPALDPVRPGRPDPEVEP